VALSRATVEEVVGYDGCVGRLLAAANAKDPTNMKIRSFALLAIVATMTTTSHARPGKTCAAVCRRLSDCKLMSFEPCMEECGKQGAEDTAKGRKSNLAQARSSCASLATAMAPSDWVCIAEGESVYGYDVDSGPPSDVRGTSTIYLPGQGKTRSQAQYSAVSDCNALMTHDLARTEAMNLEPSHEGSWGSAVSKPCHITKCYAPARPRRGKSSNR
jgi:hypothetical protein